MAIHYIKFVMCFIQYINPYIIIYVNIFATIIGAQNAFNNKQNIDVNHNFDFNIKL